MAPATVPAEAMQGWESCTLQNIYLPGAQEGSVAPESGRRSPIVRASPNTLWRIRDVAIPWLAGGNYDLGALGPLGDAINSAGKSAALRRLIDDFSLLQYCTGYPPRP